MILAGGLRGECAAVLAVFAATFPFFALIALGYLAARRGLMPLEAIPGLNVFVLYFALPCMLFRFAAGTPLAQLLDGRVALVWGVAALAMVALATATARRAGHSWNDAAFGALVAAFPNTGFMGVPLLAALMGPAVAGPVIVTIAFDMVLTSSLCIALSRLDVHEGGVAAQAVRRALGGIVRNPMPWSMVLGAVASALQWKLPAPVDRTVGMLADAASPAALFTIGAVLARSALRARDEGAQAPWGMALRDLLPVVGFKLVVHPLLIVGLVAALAAAGTGLSPLAGAALVLTAALPSASNVSMLAERYGADTGRVARIILWTTVVAFLSFPLAVAWVR